MSATLCTCFVMTCRLLILLCNEAMCATVLSPVVLEIRGTNCLLRGGSPCRTMAVRRSRYLQSRRCDMQITMLSVHTARSGQFVGSVHHPMVDLHQDGIRLVDDFFFCCQCLLPPILFFLPSPPPPPRYLSKASELHIEKHSSEAEKALDVNHQLKRTPLLVFNLLRNICVWQIWVIDCLGICKRAFQVQGIPGKVGS